jgi:cytochrome b involved in lipid metabolism
MKKIFFLSSFFLLAFVLAACGKNQAPAAPTPVKAGLTLAVVAEHNTASDCWLVVNNNIYNITDYIPAHPTGPEKIIAYCGKDATTAFDTKDANPGRPHSDAARQILEKYYIGSLSR